MHAPSARVGAGGGGGGGGQKTHNREDRDDQTSSENETDDADGSGMDASGDAALQPAADTIAAMRAYANGGGMRLGDGGGASGGEPVATRTSPAVYHHHRQIRYPVAALAPLGHSETAYAGGDGSVHGGDGLVQQPGSFAYTLPLGDDLRTTWASDGGRGKHDGVQEPAASCVGSTLRMTSCVWVPLVVLTLFVFMLPDNSDPAVSAAAAFIGDPSDIYRDPLANPNAYRKPGIINPQPYGLNPERCSTDSRTQSLSSIP